MQNAPLYPAQELCIGAIIGLVKVQTKIVVDKISTRGSSEEEDILQKMLIRSVEIMEKYRSAPENEKGVSPTSFLVTQLSFYGQNLVRSYRTQKRKAYLMFEYQEEHDALPELICTDTPDILLRIDIVDAISQLKGEVRKLADAFMAGTVHELAWSSKKLSKRKMQLREKLAEFNPNQIGG